MITKRDQVKYLQDEEFFIQQDNKEERERAKKNTLLAKVECMLKTKKFIVVGDNFSYVN